MKKKFFALFLVLIYPTLNYGQDDKSEGYRFTPLKEIKHTTVENQSRSSTCWCFSGISFLEAELIRIGKPEVDLSEMYIVRNAFSDKADKYVRMQGNVNHAGGGSYWDVIETIRRCGLVPEEAYQGLNYGEDIHTHGEIDAVTRAYLDALIKNPNRKLSTAWKRGYEGILNAYFGENPKTFMFDGKEYTPQSFLQFMGLNLDDYIYITSFSHHQFYSKFILEVPDNWAYGEVYNLPIEELGQVIRNAVENGYTVAWASDISEKGFSWKNGVAVIPDVNYVDMSTSDKERWTKLPQNEKDEQLYSFEKPGYEKVITQELRQLEFDNFKTTDDHGMHIVGTANDQNGKLYYKVKNSWGTNDKYKGYFYASEAFVLFKTTSIMINKNALPKPIARKLGLE